MSPEVFTKERNWGKTQFPQISLLGKNLRERYWKMNLYSKNLLKMNFFIGIFQRFWLQISEHLSSGCFCRGVFRILSRWSFLVNIMKGLKLLTILTKKLHLRCFTRFCVCLCSEVKSSISQTYKFKVHCNSFWSHCSVFDVVFSGIKELYARSAM